MDGLDEDLVEWCGLPPLSDEEYERVWIDADPLFSMLTCFANVEIKKKYGPEIVRHSDIFYKFIVSSEKELLALKEEIKEEILDRLKD